jgi:hypothetical protein
MVYRARHVALFAAGLLVLSLLAFHSKAPLVFFRFDGALTLIIAQLQAQWALPGWDFTSNPLQGIGGLELPQHNLTDPGLWLTQLLAPSLAPTVAMTFFALELAIAIGWLAKRLGLAPLQAAVAVSIGLLLALPYTYPAIGFEFLWGAPGYVTLILQDTAIILLLLDLGRGPRWKDWLRAGGIVALCAHQLNQYPNFAPLSFVALAFFAAVVMFTASSPRERWLKLVYLVPPMAVLLAVFGPMIYGLYGFSKATFFWYEFYPRPGSWRDVSFLVADHSRWAAKVALAAALAGAWHAARQGEDTMRTMARGFLVFVAGELLLAAAGAAGWKGPRLAYIDILAYPFYCVFAAYALAQTVAWLNRRSDFLVRRRRAALIALCVLPWLVLLDVWPRPLVRPLVRNLNPFIWPPAESPISKFLAGEIAIKPGAVFRGRVANIAGTDFEPQWASAPMITQHNYDILNLFFAGNDHRLYGLWYFGIPTLLEFNHFSSPFFHLVNARLLNKPNVYDLRSYDIQSVVNDRVMALLGTRYLISDRAQPGRKPVFSHILTKGYDLHVYEVPDANVAGYSVTETRGALAGQQAVHLMADPSLDLRRTAVLTTKEDLPTLVPAGKSTLIADRGAYRLEATSPGASLLVLPIEYSHCLEAHLKSSGATPPRLLRANLALAAVLFAGDVSGELRLRYGPLNTGCRMQDWRDADDLKIGEARNWPSR